MSVTVCIIGTDLKVSGAKVSNRGLGPRRKTVVNDIHRFFKSRSIPLTLAVSLLKLTANNLKKQKFLKYVCFYKTAVKNLG